MTMEREKIKESWEKRREELCRMADQIYDWAEVGLEETKSSALLEDYLEEQGFAVEKGVGTLPTAFRATWKQGEGGPRLGFLCEYDALEGMGHGCGHHLQGPSVIGAALAVRDRFAGKGVPFSLVIYGTPAEETIGGKTVMMEQGCFQDIDIALMMHAAPTTCVDVKSMANKSYTVEFHGVRAHAAMSPEQGRSAFDAALLSFNAIEFLREHVNEDTRMHYTVRDAGGPANVVPDRTLAQYELRSYDTGYLRSLEPRFLDILKGACLMTGTTHTITETHEFYAKIPCLTLNDLVMEQARAFGAPQLSEPRQKTGSTDLGIILYHMPGTCIRVAFVPEGTPAHSEAYLKAGKTEAAHKAIGYGSQILAAACCAILEDPEKLTAMWEEFRKRKASH